MERELTLNIGFPHKLNLLNFFYKTENLILEDNRIDFETSNVNNLILITLYKKI